MRVEGTIVCYHPRTGAGLIKDDEGREYFFEYSGAESPFINENVRAVLTRDERSMRDEISVC